MCFFWRAAVASACISLLASLFMSGAILKWLESQRETMTALLGELVVHESPSMDKSAVDRLGQKLVRELEASGAEVRTVPVTDSGDHLLGKIDGNEKDAQVLVLGHMDTVWELGALKNMPFRIQDGRAYGPGSFDMKAGLVQFIFAIRALREVGRRPAAQVVVLINSDEEVGSHCSRKLIEDEGRRSRAVLVLEPSLPPDGKLKTFRKGVGVFSLQARGRAAHAGLAPGSGVSAIEEIARQILLLHGWTDPERGITLNVGTVRGGTRINVVAAEAQAEVDLRVANVPDAREMEKRILGLQPFLEGAEVKVTGGIDRPPLERSPGVVKLYQKARQVAAELGFELGEGPAGGGSDGNLTGGLGIPTLDGLGAVGDGAHAAHEHVLVSEMPKRAALLARLLEEV